MVIARTRVAQEKSDVELAKAGYRLQVVALGMLAVFRMGAAILAPVIGMALGALGARLVLLVGGILVSTRLLPPPPVLALASDR